jgi:glycosyltransferase involved in cell wall biosynthesis
LTRSPDVSFLFVNDGSTDNTLQALSKLRSLHPAQAAILDGRENRGKAEAVRTGMLRVIRGKQCPNYVGFWDADLATPLDVIEDFLKVLQLQPEIEMVFGARVKLLGRSIDRSRMRHYLGRVFATCVSVVLGLPIYDTQCGAKIFRVNHILDQVLDAPFSSRWIFDVELIARRMNIPNTFDIPKRIDRVIYEFPLYCWRDVPGSKLRPADFLTASKELFKIWWDYARCPAREPETTQRIRNAV